jgi:hypothetical protein
MHLILWDFLSKNRILRYPDLHAHPIIHFHYKLVAILTLKQDKDYWLPLIYKNLHKLVLTSEVHKNITDNRDLDV